MMTQDAQVWKFRCAGCGETFEVEVSQGQKPSDLAQAKACPNCHRLPGPDNSWHRLVGFHSRRIAPYPRT
jgi:NAD-dependent SIR2 family protein deacetylase